MRIVTQSERMARERERQLNGLRADDFKVVSRSLPRGMQWCGKDNRQDGPTPGKAPARRLRQLQRQQARLEAKRAAAVATEAAI